MPGWHERTEPHRKAGRIQVLGIIQEQHPERCRLFMQWQQMDWPIAVDALNLLEVAAVPYTLLIDEAGDVRAINPKPDAFLTFLNSEAVSFDAPPSADVAMETHRATQLENLAKTVHTSASWADYGRFLFLWGGDAALKPCVDAYAKAVERAPEDGWLHFRLGVAYRRLFDMGQNNMNHFRRAITHWNVALDLDPNQYIWRRRIQQYGPRLDKPYSFYDWIHQAREEIANRGETPLPLSVEPGGAEFAFPASASSSTPEEAIEPDPDGRVFRDEGPGIRLDHTLVSATYADKKSVRLHLTLQPDPRHAMHWNNEAEPLTVWIDPPEGWALDSTLLTFPNPNQATDDGVRSVECEITQVGETASRTIEGYALYNVCEEIHGVCLYRRQDFSVTLTGE